MYRQSMYHHRNIISRTAINIQVNVPRYVILFLCGPLHIHLAFEDEISTIKCRTCRVLMTVHKNQGCSLAKLSLNKYCCYFGVLFSLVWIDVLIYFNNLELVRQMSNSESHSAKFLMKLFPNCWASILKILFKTQMDVVL